MHECMCVRMCCTPVGPPGMVQTPVGSHTHTFPQQQSNGSRVNVLYSTPACYLWELNKANLTWYLWGLGSLGVVVVACPVGRDPALNASVAAGW